MVAHESTLVSRSQHTLDLLAGQGASKTPLRPGPGLVPAPGAGAAPAPAGGVGAEPSTPAQPGQVRNNASNASPPSGRGARAESAGQKNRAARYAAREAAQYVVAGSNLPKKVKDSGVEEHPFHAVLGCGRRRYAYEVGIVQQGDTARFSGVLTCGSIWVCPVCAQRIRRGRADEIRTAAVRWRSGWDQSRQTRPRVAYKRKQGRFVPGRVNTDEDGNQYSPWRPPRGLRFAEGKYPYYVWAPGRPPGWLVFLTLTTRHSDKTDPVALFDFIQGGWRHLLSGAPGQRYRKRFGIVASIRSTEVTHGRHGHHPHLHLLLLVDVEPTPDVLASLEAETFRRWDDYVVKRGFRSNVTATGQQFAVKAEPVAGEADLAKYLCKVEGMDPEEGASDWGLGDEMARADLKKGRTVRTATDSPHKTKSMTQVLDVITEHRAGTMCDDCLGIRKCDAYVTALKAYRTYSEISKGARCIEWSKGLRARLGIEAVSDAQYAEDPNLEQSEERPAFLDAFDWDLVVESRAQARVLTAFENGGPGAVEDLLCELSLERQSAWGRAS